MDKKKIVFIINPISGTHSKDEIPNLIEKRLNHELYDYEIQLTGYAGHATEIARGCVERQVDVVVAVGGDGTVNEVRGERQARTDHLRGERAKGRSEIQARDL